MMTRLWPDGQPVTVSCDAQGAPQSFTWQGQRHPVSVLLQQWRVDLGWWRDRRWRAYYKLHTDTGLLVVVYQDLLSGSWFLQRLYD
jgi:hypothetical protein